MMQLHEINSQIMTTPTQTEDYRNKTGFVSKVSSFKYFLQQLIPFLKVVFFAKVPKHGSEPDSELPKLTVTKKSYYELQRNTIHFERLCFRMNPCENRGTKNVSIQPVRRRQLPQLLITSATKKYIMASTGFEYFHSKPVIFKRVWKGNQDIIQRYLYEMMIHIPEKYKKHFEKRESKTRNKSVSIGSGSRSANLSLSSSRGRTLSVSSRGSTKSKSEMMSQIPSDRSRTNIRSLDSPSQTIRSTSYYSLHRSLFLLETPVGFSSAVYFKSDKELRLAPEEYMYLLDASRFIKHSYSDPLLLLYRDTVIKVLILFLVILAFLFAVIIFTTVRNKDHLIPMIILVPILVLFCYSLLVVYKSNFGMFRRWRVYKMGKRDKFMKRKYKEVLENSEDRIPKPDRHKKRKEEKDKSWAINTNVYRFIFFIVFLSLCTSSIILTGKRFFLLMFVPMIIFVCGLCSVNYRFIPWKSVLLNYFYQFAFISIIFNPFLWPFIDKFLSSSENLLNGMIDILPFKLNVAHSVVLRLIAIYIVFYFVLELLIYNNFFQHCNVITRLISKIMNVTEIEASYVLMGVFTSYEHLIRVNSNLVTRLTKSELHFLLVAGLVNCPLPELCAYSMLGIPLSFMITFNVLSLPGTIATSKLLFPEFQISLTENRKLFPRREPITKQTRLLTDVWISSIGLASKSLFQQAFICLVMISLLKVLNFLLFKTQRGGNANDILQILSMLLQPLTICLGIESVGDQLFFALSVVKRVFITDLIAVYSLSERLHFTWVVSCLKLLNGNVGRNTFVSEEISRFLNLLMIEDFFEGVTSTRSLFMTIPLVCTFATIPRIILSTSHLASVLPSSRQKSLTWIGFRALCTAFISKMILTFFAGNVFSDVNELSCKTEYYWGYNTTKTSFCLFFLEEFPQASYTNVTKLSISRPIGIHEIHCLRLRQFKWYQD